MIDTLSPSSLSPQAPGPQEAWQMVMGRLRPEMSKALFETWVEPLRPLGFQQGVFTLGAANPYGRDWVESRLNSSLARLFEGVYGSPVRVQVVVTDGFTLPLPAPTPAEPEAEDASPAAPTEPGRRENRKVMLQRAYGSRRASVIQPERGMFLTLYFFNNWLPLLGQSAVTVILAARSLCYWNPLTGELRNTIDTEMADLAGRAAVSVRTVKDVLNHELVRRYFLRYLVRRVMTPNGVRTAGITLQVRMDDPLTPGDQAEYNLPEEERWYTPQFEDEED
jgi:hypothetical protein